MAERLFEIARRTFDTPEFRGLEFIEAECKTTINHVPGDYLPFKHTINPYRGCSHSCSYCMSGDTEVLLADGRTKPIAKIEVGDRIYGTERRGWARRCVTTDVLAHWSTVKPAFRVTLADGTELIASGGHRFLTERGWKHVTGSEQGRDRRPFLTTNDALVGVGGFASARTRRRVDVEAIRALVAWPRVPTPSWRKGFLPLRVVAIEPLDVDLPMFDLTTGTGDFIANGVISHNCFARPTHTYLDMNAGRDFETKIVVKVNAPEVLRRQLAARRWKGEGIAMGTNTDPYQRAEGRYRLMPPIIRALTDFRNPFSILTKGTLILRDLDLLVEAAGVTDVATAFSIGTLDEDAWRRSEPGTPHPRKRIEAVAALNAAGIPCGVLMAPILPGITDHPRQLREVVRAAIDAGATHVSPIMLHLRPGVREEFMPWLAEHYPDLVARYEAIYAKPYASPSDRNRLGATVGGIVRALGGIRAAPDPPRRRRSGAGDGDAPEGEQLSLV